MKDNSVPKQTIDNLKGEIKFRRLLAQQHVTGEILLPDYFDKEAHDKILADRIATTRSAMKRLLEKGVNISSFIELGAERCQRSLLLVNEFDAQGIAADISLDQLQTASHFAKLFNWSKLPLRVCCDINNLPIRDSTFPFAFCYEFLHHFPAVKPIIKQIYRILDNGHFYFSEEPFKRPRIRLYRQRSKIYAKHVLRRNKIIRTLEKFISEPWSDEIEHGVVENDQTSVSEWNKALSIFDKKDVRLASVGGRITSRLHRRIYPGNFLNMILGGGISGVCSKTNSHAAPVNDDLLNRLICPDCQAKHGSAITKESTLYKEGDTMTCEACSSCYPIVDGVIILLKEDLFRTLYPEFIVK